MRSWVKVWSEPDGLLPTVRRLLYVRCDLDAARAHLPRLRVWIKKLPRDDGSIGVAELQAVYHELCGDFAAAIAFRNREVELLGMLHEHIRKHNYDRELKAAMLAGRDRAAVAVRKRIIRALERKVREQAGGTSGRRSSAAGKVTQGSRGPKNTKPGPCGGATRRNSALVRSVSRTRSMTSRG